MPGPWPYAWACEASTTVWISGHLTSQNSHSRRRTPNVRPGSPKHTGVITAGRMTYINGTYTDGNLEWTVIAPPGEEIGGATQPTCE